MIWWYLDNERQQLQIWEFKLNVGDIANAVIDREPMVW